VETGSVTGWSYTDAVVASEAGSLVADISKLSLVE
jgi:hypothetical protein